MPMGERWVGIRKIRTKHTRGVWYEWIQKRIFLQQY
nr:MAG TPA: hypothetical protein [Caudoviricetes sp.]